MSMVSDVEKMIFDNFSDNCMHTVDEYRKLAVEKHIILPNNKSAIRNTIYKLRDNPKFEIVSKGRYIVHCKEMSDEDNMSVDDAFDYLSKRLREIKRLDVIKNSNEELDQGKKEVELYRKYISEFMKVLNWAEDCMEITWKE